MSFTEINVKEFIERMINYENVDDILEMGKTQSEKGFLYERLWDICIKFGFVEVFPRADFTHLTGNSNTGKMKKVREEKLVKGYSVTDVEAKVTEKYQNFTQDWRITAVSESKIDEVFQ
jgi:hypothetical protein